MDAIPEEYARPRLIEAAIPSAQRSQARLSDASPAVLSTVLATFEVRDIWADLKLCLPEDVELLAFASPTADGIHDPEVAHCSWP
jgi:hypothetical protein